MKKIGYRIKNENSGITLISLVVTIIVIIILATIGINTGVTTLKSSQLTRFTAQMKLMQLEVNELYEKYISDGTVITKEGTKFVGKDILNIGKDLSIANQEQINKIFKTSAEGGSNILDKSGYRYFDAETIKSLKIDGIDQEFLVNVQKRSFISLLGFKHDNEMYYTLDQLPDGLYNVEYINPNTGKPTFDVNYEKLTNGKWKININNIKYEDGEEGYITKWNVKYQLADTQKPDKWYTSDELSFIVDRSGKYRILIYQQDVQSNFVEIEVKEISKIQPDVTGINNKTYVTWSDNGDGTYTINDTHTIEPDYWYDYDNGKWANIKTEANGLEAYWVWIPRYAYVKPTSTTATQIDVKFIGTDVTSSNVEEKVGTGYMVHPAFTVDTKDGTGKEELKGIWVAKYEASSNTPNSDSNYGGGDDLTLKVQVKPGVQSWRVLTTTASYNVCAKMTQAGEVIEGSTVDPHMMKNMEWGAVAILSQSKYGVFNPESATGDTAGIGDGTHQVWNNPYGYDTYKTIKTGYAGNTADASTPYDSAEAPKDVSEYNRGNGPKASTTGTVYGVYDMAGGSWERVSGVVMTTGSENTPVEKPDYRKALMEAPDRYSDKYTNPGNVASNYEGAKDGDATRETKGWNSDGAGFPYAVNPVFSRGGIYLSGSGAGVFCFSSNGGNGLSNHSFRPVLFP